MIPTSSFSSETNLQSQPRRRSGDSPILSRKRRVFGFFVWLFCTIGFLVLSGELFLLFFNSQVFYYPRWRFSPQYVLVLPSNTTIVHERPRKWVYSYTMNERGFRGKSVVISNRYDKANVVVLGDSYGMGTAVQDGEEFAAVIDRELDDRIDVINTSIGGWGLTQEIRCFYEFGQLYEPKVVILQFCVNDPNDNLSMKVTTVDKGIFRFHDSTHPKWLLGRLVSESYLLQHSQLYSLFRKVYEVRRERHAAQVASTGHSSTAEAVSEADAFYNELLEAFAVDLHARGVHFAMVSMDEWLARRPHVAEKVRELESLGLLDYIGVERCMGEAPVSWSPEGHWDKNTHRAIGLALSRIIEQRYLP